MKHIRLILLVAIACMLFSATTAFARVNSSQPAISPNNPTSADLVNHPKEWDGKTITFTGEAITQAMVRGDHAWIHVNDDAYYLKNVEEGTKLNGYNSGHAVWLPTSLVAPIRYYGDYRHEGDVVTVKGTFNAACAIHGGDMDIHATSLVVDIPGHPVTDPIHPLKALAALVMVVLAVLMYVAYRKATHKERFGAG